LHIGGALPGTGKPKAITAAAWPPGIASRLLAWALGVLGGIGRAPLASKRKGPTKGKLA